MPWMTNLLAMRFRKFPEESEIVGWACVPCVEEVDEVEDLR